MALPVASPADFAGGRRPPADAHPDLLKRINDTALRTKLVETGIAEGLQSPKGPQKIASIVRIYPAFNAPPRAATNGRKNARLAVNGRKNARPAAGATPRRGLPTVEDMEKLIGRIREVEREVAGELAHKVDEQIATLKRMLADSTGEDLEHAYHQLGAALAERRELTSRVRGEAFSRIENDPEFGTRVHLRVLDRS
jgi:hypothetical protein